MSLVGKVGRKRLRSRLAIGVIYCLLIVGAVTTVYPFLFMMTTGFKGPTDQNDNRLVPLYWTDSAELVKKTIDDKYAGDADIIASSAAGSKADAATVAKYEQFLMGLRASDWRAGFRVPPQGVTSRLARKWQGFLRKKYRDDLDALNRAYVDLNQAFQQVPVPVEAWERASWRPPENQKWSDWMEFKATLGPEYRIPIRAEWMFQEFLRAKFKNRIADVPEAVRGAAKSFSEVRWTQDGELRNEFVLNNLPARYVGRTIEQEWAQVSKEPLPVNSYDRSWIERNAQDIRHEMTWRNFGYVADLMVLNGRALWNTALFCLLAILVHLTVNPLAAYALSRFPMKSTAKILLFFLATMAFPAEVAMIPSFLLLKDLHLLNTFAALVLPGAASGFTIYLLKGFFDSLPGEVFDSGQVDGAPEWVMMFRLALPLSKPVLGYIALTTFMGAYGAFMYAFLVCQDSRMWTLMVLVYQLQIQAPKAVVMAAVAMAALPTLIVFLSCQRVIMRGIVLPSER